MSQERKIDIKFDNEDTLIVEYNIKGPETPRRWSQTIPLPGRNITIDYFQDAGSDTTIFFTAKQHEPSLIDSVKYTLWEAHKEDPSALPEVIQKLQAVTSENEFSVRRLTKISSVIFDLEKLINSSEGSED